MSQLWSNLTQSSDVPSAVSLENGAAKGAADSGIVQDASKAGGEASSAGPSADLVLSPPAASKSSYGLFDNVTIKGSYGRVSDAAPPERGFRL